MHATFITMAKESLNNWLNFSIIGRAQRNNILSTYIINILDSVKNHHQIDDSPYGGGAGELMRIDIIAPLINQALELNSNKSRDLKKVILLDPAGQVFNQNHAQRLSKFEELIFVCGRFEGIDARIYNFVDESMSLGDFVLSCGELAALSIFDATARLVPGVLGNSESLIHESHTNGRLESSNFTRPSCYNNLLVPEVYKNGDHKNINLARKQESIIKTIKIRPDLIKKYPLSLEEKEITNNNSQEKYFWQKLYE